MFPRLAITCCDHIIIHASHLGICVIPIASDRAIKPAAGDLGRRILGDCLNLSLNLTHVTAVPQRLYLFLYTSVTRPTQLLSNCILHHRPSSKRQGCAQVCARARAMALARRDLCAHVRWSSQRAPHAPCVSSRFLLPPDVTTTSISREAAKGRQRPSTQQCKARKPQPPHTSPANTPPCRTPPSPTATTP